MSNLPVPKFQIGNTVYVYDLERKSKQLSCPDCLGEKKWTVITPGGSQLTVACQRCAERFTNVRDLPSLTYLEYVSRACKLTVGSVRIDTSEREANERVKYMCHETGIGGGRVYREDLFFLTEEEALAAGERAAEQLNVKERETPERLKQVASGYLKLLDAIVEQAWSSNWNAWYAYTRLKENIEEYLKEHPNAEIQSIIDWEQGYCEAPKLEEVRRALVNGDLELARSWFLKDPILARVASPGEVS